MLIEPSAQRSGCPDPRTGYQCWFPRASSRVVGAEGLEPRPPLVGHETSVRCVSSSCVVPWSETVSKSSWSGWNRPDSSRSLTSSDKNAADDGGSAWRHAARRLVRTFAASRRTAAGKSASVHSWPNSAALVVLRRVRQEIEGTGISGRSKTAADKELDSIERQLHRREPDKPTIGASLARLTKVLASAGTLMTGGTTLLNGITALATWLGTFGHERSTSFEAPDELVRPAPPRVLRRPGPPPQCVERGADTVQCAAGSDRSVRPIRGDSASTSMTTTVGEMGLVSIHPRG